MTTISPSSAALGALDRLRFPSGLSFTRNGDAVLASVRNASADGGKPNPARIWRFGAHGALQMTDGPNGDWAPKPSPCDERIAFLSDRACRGKSALYLLHEDCTVQGVGSVPGTIEDYRWTSDASAIVVLAADRGLNGGATNGAARIWWGEDESPQLASCPDARRRLFLVRLEDGHTEEVGPPGHTVWEFDLLPEGAVVVASEDASERGWYHAQLLRLRFADRSTALLHTTAWQMQGLAADPAGRRVAFLEGWSSDRGLVAGEMRVLDLESGRVDVLAAERQSSVTALRWRDTGSLWFAGWEGLGTVYGVVALDGAIEWQRHEDAVLGESSYLAQITPSGAGGRIAAVRETVGEPPEIVWRHAADAQWTTLTDLNVQAARAFPGYPEVRRIAWRGADGLELESLVLLPAGHGNQPLPMVVDIHGGPCYATHYSYNTGGALAYAAAGFAVFMPNYRGNVGWGQQFARMNLGDPAGAEFGDIMAGVQQCIALGYADPERLGVTGSSYGGFLTNWAVATSTRFKAAVAVSSIADQVSCHYACEHDFHAFINGGPLTDEVNMRVAIERSPLRRLRNPVTPVLLIHGSDDRCTPLSEAQQFYAAVRERGVPAELAVYPGEGHGGFRSRAHRIDSWQRRIAWFELFLNGDKA